MAYSLNTDASTQKITLCSSGTYTGTLYRPSFTLSKAIVLDGWLLHLCSMEIVLLKHPTYFHLNYMNGEVHLIDADETIQKHHIDQIQNQEVFNPWLEGVYFNIRPSPSRFH